MPFRIGKVSEIGKNLPTTREKLLAAIARSTEELSSGKGWPDGIIDLLTDLGEITGVSRVWIFQLIELGPDYIIQDYPFEWADRQEHVQLHMPKFNMSRNAIENDEYRELIESRKRGEWQSVIVSELNDGWLKQDQERQKILSMLTIPIMVEGEWWGTLGFDDCLREHRWSDAEIALLRMAAHLISTSIMRDRLSTKKKQIDILQDITESSSWELDLRKGHFWCSQEIIGNMGMVSESVHLSGRKALGLVHPDDRRELLDTIRRHMSGGERTFRLDLRAAIECGIYVWVEIIGAVTRDADGRVEKIAGIAVEILKRKQEEEKLRREAKKDPLTGADNRAAFEKKFVRLLEQGRNEERPFSLLLLDLDHFKIVNDTWGHDVGDGMLMHFSEMCRRNLRSSDSFARIGGEEFAILLPDADKDAAQAIGRRIIEDVRSMPLQINGREIPLTVSIGCAGYPFAGEVGSRSHFFKLADMALYAAKRAGRDRLVAADDSGTTCTLRSAADCCAAAGSE